MKESVRRGSLKKLSLTLFFTISVIALYPGQGVWAQALGGTSGANSQQQTPEPQDPGLGAILESGADWLISLASDDYEKSARSRWNSYDTPRATVMTFTSAMTEVRLGNEEAWPRALGALGHSAGNEEGGEEGADDQARQRAEALFGVFERIGQFGPYDLPGEAALEKRQMSRFVVFPYGVSHVWVWEALENAPAGRIVLVREGMQGAPISDADSEEANASAHWRFSDETLAGASELLASIESLPPRYQEQQVGGAFLSAAEKIRQTSLPAWLALLASIVAGVLLAFAVHWGLTRAGEALETRHRDYLGSFIRTLSAPIAIVVFVVAFTAGLGFVNFPPALDQLRWGVLQFITVLAVAAFVFKLVDLLAVWLLKVSGARGTPYDETTALLLHRALRTITFILVALFVLQNMMGLNIGALLTGVGILGIALSLAGQGIFKNALGGFNIFINQPFLVGDWIQFDGHIGSVEDVGLYATKVRLRSGEMLTVPNMRFIDEQVENLDERCWLRREMDIAITYDTPRERIERAIELVREVLQSDEVVSEGGCDLEQRPPKVSFSHYGPYFLNIRAYYWYFIEDGETPQRDSERGWYSFLEHCSLVNLKLKHAFDEAEIEFAFPTETHFLSEDARRGLKVQFEKGDTNDPGGAEPAQ